jgi:hypothetical protein
MGREIEPRQWQLFERKKEGINRMTKNIKLRADGDLNENRTT